MFEKDKALICHECAVKMKNSTSKMKIKEIGNQIHDFNKFFLFAESTVFKIPYGNHNFNNMANKWQKYVIPWNISYSVDINSNKIPVQDGGKKQGDDKQTANQTKQKKRTTKHVQVSTTR